MDNFIIILASEVYRNFYINFVAWFTYIFSYNISIKITALQFYFKNRNIILVNHGITVTLDYTISSASLAWEIHKRSLRRRKFFDKRSMITMNEKFFVVLICDVDQIWTKYEYVCQTWRNMMVLYPLLCFRLLQPGCVWYFH